VLVLDTIEILPPLGKYKYTVTGVEPIENPAALRKNTGCRRSSEGSYQVMDMCLSVIDGAQK
jgi:hypothetical protein